MDYTLLVMLLRDLVILPFQEIKLELKDEISKKITNTGQEAVQKAKGVTEITKINSQIADLEKEIDGLKLEIGKIVVIQSVEKTSENLKNWMGEKKDEIAEYIANNPKQWELDRLYSQE